MSPPTGVSEFIQFIPGYALLQLSFSMVYWSQIHLIYN